MVPPANRRVEFNGSGAPSWMMAQPQSAQGCAVCGAPSDPLDETREPAKRAVCRGRRLLVLFAKESGSFQSHSPQPEGRAKPLRGQGPRVLHGEAMPIRREGTCQPSGRPQKNRSHRAAVFLLAQPVDASSATGLRRGASWSCRRCLPALCPSR